MSPKEIGHSLFWLLKSGMHNSDIRHRYGAVLQLYLRNCGEHRPLLGLQVRFIYIDDDHFSIYNIDIHMSEDVCNEKA